MLHGFMELATRGFMSRARGCRSDVLGERLKIRYALRRDVPAQLRLFGIVAKTARTVLQCIHSLVNFPLALPYARTDFLDLVEFVDSVVPASGPKRFHGGLADAYEVAQRRRRTGHRLAA
jgi:hypothetical protein